MRPQTAARPTTYGLDPSNPTFTLDRYQRMIDAGILDDEDRVELLENFVVLEVPRNPQHDNGIDRVHEALLPRKPRGWRLRIRSAITLSDSQPEPDLALVRGDLNSFELTHPGPADCGLLVEVANTSLLRDKQDKARIYARAGIPTYWIVNLVDSRVEVFEQPSGPAPAPAYSVTRTYEPGWDVPLSVDGTTVGPIPAADLLG